MDSSESWANHEAFKWLLKRAWVYLLVAMFAGVMFLAIAPFLP